MKARIHRLPPVLVLAGFLSMPGNAQGGTADTAWRDQVLSPLRTEPAVASCGDPCDITATIDRAGLFAAMPLLQRHGVLSARITAEEMRTHPAYFSNALALLAASWTAHDAYAANPALARTHWRVKLSGPNAQGGIETRDLFEYDFDRRSFDAMDWAPKSFVHFPSAAPGFRTNLRLVLEMSRELGGGIGED